MSKSKIVSQKYKKIRFVIFAVLSIFLLGSLIFSNYLTTWINNVLYPPVSTNVEDCELKVHIIDVGQGDSILIELPDNKIMLVDAGPNSSETKLLTYLNNFYSNRQDRIINYFVATHQHEDHIGGGDMVFENFDVLCFYRPNVYTTQEIAEYGYNTSEVGKCDSIYYIPLISKMKEENCEVYVNKQSANPFFLSTDCGYTIEYLSPRDNKYTEENNYSPIMKITYMGRSIILTGDAETKVENQVIEDYIETEIQCDILKLGHHGSDTSTSQNFLDAVNPTYIAISVGEGNSYHHPNDVVLARAINKVGEQNIYRTDTMGTLIFGIDKDNMTHGKAEIKITNIKGYFIQMHVEWWYIVLSVEGVLFTLLIIPIFTTKSNKKLKKKH